MNINWRFAAVFVAVFQCSLSAQDEILFAELGGVSAVSIPQPPPLPGLLATKVVFRTAPDTQIVTFENMNITGAVHQVFIPIFAAPIPTPRVDGPYADVIPSEWIEADSHLSISRAMVKIVFGQEITESNDEGNQAGANESLPLLVGEAAAVTGIGDLGKSGETDGFIVVRELQTNEIDFAYLVTPDDGTPNDGTPNDNVFLTVGVLGAGFINSGDPDGASFGFNGNDPVPIPFVPEPAAATLAIFALAALITRRR
jgi:hypothetical protein